MGVRGPHSGVHTGTRSYVTLICGFVVGWGVWAARPITQAMVAPVAWGRLFCDALGQGPAWSRHCIACVL